MWWPTPNARPNAASSPTSLPTKAPAVRAGKAQNPRRATPMALAAAPIKAARPRSNSRAACQSQSVGLQTRAPMLVRSLPLFRPTSFLVGAGLVAYAGCSTSSATTVAVTHQTMIEVSPDDFLGNVPCATEGPGLKRYVATLFDLNIVGGASGAAGSSASAGTDSTSGGSAVAAPFQLPSSTPTPCVAAVGFGYVTPGRRYEVQIDGFDTDDLRPRAVGSRQMMAGIGGGAQDLVE